MILVVDGNRLPVSHDPTTPNSRLSSWILSIRGSAVAAVFSSFILFEGNLPELALSAIPISALFFAYVSFTPRTAGGRWHPPSIDFVSALLPLSIRVAVILIPILCFESEVFGRPQSLLLALSVGVLRALSWFFVVQTVGSQFCRRSLGVVSRRLTSTPGPIHQLACCSRNINLRYSCCSRSIHRNS